MKTLEVESAPSAMRASRSEKGARSRIELASFVATECRLQCALMRGSALLNAASNLGEIETFSAYAKRGRTTTVVASQR